jgi:SAM-dependent methyltransferase
MQPQTAGRLLDLNRQFYQTFGGEFASTRQRLQPGVKRILERLHGDEVLLDLGCGNGEVARQLARDGHRGAYTGLDLSLPLLEAAGRQPEGFPARFLQADLSAPDWEHVLASRGSLAARPPPPGEVFTAPRGSPRNDTFDMIFAFAVLHHLPGAGLRLGILRKAHTRLRPDGLFVHSEWQFLDSPRLRRRLQPWEAAGLSAADVEAGDYLLDWRRGGHGLRYVHYFDEAELAALAAGSGFEVLETFRLDGEGGKLGLYQIWGRLPSGQ